MIDHPAAGDSQLTPAFRRTVTIGIPIFLFAVMLLFGIFALLR